MKTFPSWLIYIAAIGVGFFGFVIAGGVLLKLAAGAKLAGLAVMILVILVSLAAAYFTFKYSRRFMLRHVSRNAGPGDLHFSEGRTAQKKRLAIALFFGGLILFPVFIFAMLSSIINLYV